MPEDKPTMIQSFDLVPDRLSDFYNSNIISKLHMGPTTTTVKATRSIIHGLFEKGYLVYHSNTATSGVPDTMLVMGRIGMDIKGDFYGLAGKAGLPFQSGPCFFDYVQEREYVMKQSNLEELTQH